MKQAIAGVVPADAQEVKLTTVWPSLSVYRLGSIIGQLCAIRWPGVYIFRLGNLMALLSIGPAILLYFWRVAPVTGIRYTLTNRRIVVQKGMKPVDDRSIDLDEFDSIEIESGPSQQWYHAGDLVFKSGGSEKFRLESVSYPETFRRSCLASQTALVGVRELLEREATPA